MADRSGIEIDYCPECRGVWLDRGELDKIIERTSAPAPSPSSQKMHSSSDDDRKHYDSDYKKYKYGKKSKGLLGDIFDF
jgi:Zn-finger nucleic acid-binding protein